MIHSTHFIYGYMTIQIAREDTRCCHYMGYSFRLAARVLLYASLHTHEGTCNSLRYTSCGTLLNAKYIIFNENTCVVKTIIIGGHLPYCRSGCSSEVERSLMVRWVVGSILHGVDPLSYFSFQPV